MTSLTKQMQTMFKFDDKHSWLRDADLTYSTARHLLLSDNVWFRGPAGYLLHLAVEKYFKALRLVIRPQINVERHAHDLDALFASLLEKVPNLKSSKIEQELKKVEKLKMWRYADSASAKTSQVMQDGLSAADYIVATIREEIPEEIRFQGVHRILQLNGPHCQLLVEALFTGNSHSQHWRSDLLGISSHVDGLIEATIRL